MQRGPPPQIRPISLPRWRLTAAPTSLSDALRDRYVLERELGRGGMATVYLARDLKHDRLVALKVLRPDLAATLGPERFQREIRLAARLQHPHILGVHDSGETAGQFWFTTPLVEGESLRDRLRRETQLPVEDALRIATDTARALQYAHNQGVVHRDIKPENLLLTKDGSTLVADFGIARVLEAAGVERLTETGLSVGTPAYMSPEQATGDRTLDARSDQYSLACVLYEMLVGEPPFTGPTAQAVNARRLRGEVLSLRLVRPSVPATMEHAVLRALAPVPADRFPDAAAFSKAIASATPPQTAVPAPTTVIARPHVRARRRISGIIVACVAAFFVVGGLLLRRGHAGRPERAVGPPVLAVLPFENIGPDQKEYFADGMTDAVRGKLAALTGFRVIARGSSAQYKKTDKTPQQIGKELAAQYLLTATVRWETSTSGTSRVQVSPELIQVGDATTRWQQVFDANLSDVFTVQADIAARVAQALDVAMRGNERERLAETPTTSVAAYDAFLKGEEISNALAVTVPGVLRQAAGYYAAAVALDSTFALAWAQLARAHARIFQIVESRPADADRARVAAVRSLALAPSAVEGRLAMGEYYALVRNDHVRAFEQYEIAQRVGPASADVLASLASEEASLGRWDQSIAHFEQAQALDPRSLRTAQLLAFSLLCVRRYPQALAAVDRALALAPSVATLHIKVMVYLAQGDLATARQVIRSARTQIDPTSLVSFFAAYFDLYWVLDEEQQTLLLRLTPKPFDDNRAVWGDALAGVYALRGDPIRARAYADSARLAAEAQVRAEPSMDGSSVELGVANAYLGRRVEAIRAGERAVALRPVTKDATTGAHIQHELARIYLLVGEPEKALDLLEPLLKIPYYLSPGWLKIDPTFVPLRGNPRFERLVEGKP